MKHGGITAGCEKGSKETQEQKEVAGRRRLKSNNPDGAEGEFMAKAMTKSQFVAKLAEKASLTRKAAADILDFIAETAYKEAKNSFTLPGLGKLVLVQRKARMGRNPATGETIKIKAKKVVKFRVAKAAKDAILGAK